MTSDPDLLTTEAVWALGTGALLEACWLAGYRLVYIGSPVMIDNRRTILVEAQYPGALGEPRGTHHLNLRHPTDRPIERDVPALWSIVERYVGEVIDGHQHDAPNPTHGRTSHCARAYTETRFVTGNHYWDGTDRLSNGELVYG